MYTLLRKHPYLTLLMFSLFLYLIGNELLPVTDTAESNYAVTAKEMVLSGDWISPQIYGHYWYDKPIFYYWELALSYTLFGFNEMASRLPPSRKRPRPLQLLVRPTRLQRKDRLALRHHPWYLCRMLASLESHHHRHDPLPLHEYGDRLLLHGLYRK